jgi:tRNA pseudouridine38-40 synthase
MSSEITIDHLPSAPRSCEDGPMLRRAKLIIAYLGTPFSGWQRQSRQVTVQGELEAALQRTTRGQSIPVVGAGRTDAGVHARGQVAHLDLPVSIPVEVLPRALNATLPEAVRVLSASVVSGRFHARTSALAKLYVYRARWHPPILPWQGLRHAVLPQIGDEDSLVDAMRLLVGVHDMASFTVPLSSDRTTRRELYWAWGRRRPDGLDLHFVGDGFLRYQVRRMVGALLEVGWGRRDLGSFRRLVEHPQAGAHILTAPARGLTLERVYYRVVPNRPPPETANLLW